MDDYITKIDSTELSFYDDLIADVEAGLIADYSSEAVRDNNGNEEVFVVLPDGTKATVDGTRFAESDWEECGRLEVHAIDLHDDLDRAALEA